MIQGFSKRLQMARLNCELSRKQVAELLGVSESLIGLYETDTRQPSIATLMKLANLYHVSTDYLLGCEHTDRNMLSLDGLSSQQIQALSMIIQCFRTQFH